MNESNESNARSVDDLCMGPLSPDAVKSRKGRGRDSFDYVPGEYVIATLCEIFGSTGWSSKVVSLDRTTGPELFDKTVKDWNTRKERTEKRWRVSYIARVRLTCLESGATKEDYGFGSSEEKDPLAIHESAVKEAVTDAIKRAARQLGWRLGLALYDKERKHVRREDDDGDDAPRKGKPPRDAEGLTDHLRNRREGAPKEDPAKVIMRVVTALGEVKNANELQRAIVAERGALAGLSNGHKREAWGVICDRGRELDVPEDALKRWMSEDNARG
ncbi:MAG: Rad52/Rad22 family DNA repair protein [Sandaracinaceae bacterium]